MSARYYYLIHAWFIFVLVQWICVNIYIYECIMVYVCVNYYLLYIIKLPGAYALKCNEEGRQALN